VKKSLATGPSPPARRHCGRSQRSPIPLSWVEGVAFQYFLTAINQIALSENAPKLSYEHLQNQNVSGV